MLVLFRSFYFFKCVNKWSTKIEINAKTAKKVDLPWQSNRMLNLYDCFNAYGVVLKFA